MPAITSSLIGPADAARSGATVRFDLVDAAGTPLDQGWLAAANKTIIGTSEVTADAAGAYTITVPANVDITPAGTRWRRRIFPTDGSRAITAFLVVPAGGGPYNEDDIAVQPAPTPAAQAPARGLLGRAKMTGAAATAVTKNTTAAETMPGMSLVVTTGVLPVRLRFVSDYSTATIATHFIVRADGTDKAWATIEGSSDPRRRVVAETVVTDLAAGSHTIDVRWALTAAGSASVYPNGYLLFPSEVTLEVEELGVGW